MVGVTKPSDSEQDDITIYSNRAYLKPNTSLDHTYILLFVLTRCSFIVFLGTSTLPSEYKVYKLSQNH